MLRPLVGRGLRTRRMESRHLGGARPRTPLELMLTHWLVGFAARAPAAGDAGMGART